MHQFPAFGTNRKKAKLQIIASSLFLCFETEESSSKIDPDDYFSSSILSMIHLPFLHSVAAGVFFISPLKGLMSFYKRIGSIILLAIF